MQSTMAEKEGRKEGRKEEIRHCLFKVMERLRILVRREERGGVQATGPSTAFPKFKPKIQSLINNKYCI